MLRPYFGIKGMIRVTNRVRFVYSLTCCKLDHDRLVCKGYLGGGGAEIAVHPSYGSGNSNILSDGSVAIDRSKTPGLPAWLCQPDEKDEKTFEQVSNYSARRSTLVIKSPSRDSCERLHTY